MGGAAIVGLIKFQLNCLIVRAEFLKVLIAAIPLQ